eukprot:GHRR01005906.1.p1 GENE.GHRR01005906.1~~GHRR01005906.1.p1  ORF type:complete len:577 (+),score=240.08 GHRR01005906.1:1424-3154(+)
MTALLLQPSCCAIADQASSRLCTVQYSCSHCTAFQPCGRVGAAGSKLYCICCCGLCPAGEKVQLHGFSAFDAATHCAAVSAAKRLKAKTPKKSSCGSTSNSGSGSSSPSSGCPSRAQELADGASSSSSSSRQSSVSSANTGVVSGNGSSSSAHGRHCGPSAAAQPNPVPIRARSLAHESAGEDAASTSGASTAGPRTAGAAGGVQLGAQYQHFLQRQHDLYLSQHQQQQQPMQQQQWFDLQSLCNDNNNFSGAAASATTGRRASCKVHSEGCTQHPRQQVTSLPQLAGPVGPECLGLPTAGSVASSSSSKLSGEWVLPPINGHVGQQFLQPQQRDTADAASRSMQTPLLRAPSPAITVGGTATATATATAFSPSAAAAAAAAKSAAAPAGPWGPAGLPPGRSMSNASTADASALLTGANTLESYNSTTAAAAAAAMAAATAPTARAACPTSQDAAFPSCRSVLDPSASDNVSTDAVSNRVAETDRQGRTNSSSCLLGKQGPSAVSAAADSVCNVPCSSIGSSEASCSEATEHPATADNSSGGSNSNESDKLTRPSISKVKSGNRLMRWWRRIAART